MTAPLLAVEALELAFPQAPAPAVQGLSFTLDRGEALGLIGGSGSGKSLSALALLGLPPRGARLSGQIRFDGQPLLGTGADGWRRLRGAQIGAVFQDPVASLNPYLRIGTQLAEGLERHRGLGRAAALAEAARWLDAVQLGAAAARLRQYPHELSGGQCQRVALAMALCCRPRLLIADEPTTALDATTQALLLDLLRGLQRELALALLLISHDLAVVATLCPQALVLHEGRVVERGTTAALMQAPAHPYTRRLVAARPPAPARLRLEGIPS